MSRDIASVGDAGLSAPVENVGSALISGLNIGESSFNSAFKAMTDPLKDTPSIKDFLLKCPLALFNA